MKETKLTERERRLLFAIDSFVVTNLPLRLIAKFMGLKSHKDILGMLKKLKEKGVVVNEPYVDWSLSVGVGYRPKPEANADDYLRDFPNADEELSSLMRAHFLTHQQ